MIYFFEDLIEEIDEMDDRWRVVVSFTTIFQFWIGKVLFWFSRNHWIPENPRPIFSLKKQFWTIERNNIGFSGFTSDLTTELHFRFKHFEFTIKTDPKGKYKPTK